MFSRAQASARGSWSVATTRLTPRRASTAASTPVPVPMSKASSCRAGSGASATRSHVFAAHRREHAVVRMDARAERRDLDALLAPLVRADQAEQFAQRDHRGLAAGTVGFRAGLPHVGRAPQRDGCSRRRAAAAACPACARAATGPGDGDGRPRPGRAAAAFWPCAACGRRAAPSPAATGARSGNRRATAARCLRRPGDRRRRPSSCRRRSTTRLGGGSAALRAPAAPCIPAGFAPVDHRNHRIAVSIVHAAIISRCGVLRSGISRNSMLPAPVSCGSRIALTAR